MKKEMPRRKLILGVGSSHLLSLQVLIEKIESRFAGLGATHDSEHAFSSIIVWG